MQPSNEPMMVALQVLFAINDKLQPDATDVELLKSYAPSLADAPIDDLACEVIYEALKRRAEQRAQGSAAD